MAKTVTKVLKTPEDLAQWVTFLTAQTLPITVAQTPGAKKTNPQNRTIHLWFGEIAAHRGDTTLAEVKAECNLEFGLGIMNENQEWRDAFGFIFQSLNYKSKLKAIRVLDIPFTRKMTAPQLSGYMDEMAREYRQRGVYLTDPELQGYEQR